MEYFQTQNHNLGQFWRALEWKLLVNSMAIRKILLPFGIHTLWPFGILVAIWYIFTSFGILCQEKSGNPVGKESLRKSPSERLH
jgi:hypothetical protein